MKKKLLVTGSCGFIFSNFVRKALYEKLNYSLVSIDKVTNPANLHNVYSNKGHTFYIADVSDSHTIDLIFSMEKPDLVIHGAAESFVDDSIAKPEPFMNSNVLGTQVMLNMAVKHKIQRFLYVSTDEVYGQLGLNDNSWTEDAQINPRNPYSASKAAGELLVKAANQTYGLEYNITRSCNNFGPRQSIKNFIPKIIKSINNNIPIPVYGKGEQIREWMHVDDHCSALLKVIGGPANQTYNISTGAEFTNLELVGKICQIMGKGEISFVPDRLGHDFRYSINANKIKELGWKPNIKFKEGLQQTCEWYLRNDWFMKTKV